MKEGNVKELQVMMMEIKEMSNTQLFRHLICEEREIKTHQSTIKQIKDEINTRFDNGTLVEGKEEENE